MVQQPHKSAAALGPNMPAGVQVPATWSTLQSLKVLNVSNSNVRGSLQWAWAATCSHAWATIILPVSCCPCAWLAPGSPAVPRICSRCRPQHGPASQMAHCRLE